MKTILIDDLEFLELMMKRVDAEFDFLLLSLLMKTLRTLGSNRMMLRHTMEDVHNYLNEVFAER